MTISNSAMQYGSRKQLESAQRLDALLAAVFIDELCGYPASATRDEFGLASAARGLRATVVDAVVSLQGCRW